MAYSSDCYNTVHAWWFCLAIIPWLHDASKVDASFTINPVKDIIAMFFYINFKQEIDYNNYYIALF